MSEKVTADLIRAQGRQLRSLEVDAARAGELAVEVERLSHAVLDAATHLDFNDEPGRFLAQLHAARATGSKRR